MTPLDDALTRLDAARTPADLFGADAAEAARRYRRLARAVHPDATGGRTHDAFTRLNALWRAYHGADAATITGGRHAYRLDGDPIGGDVAELYPARTDGGTRVLLKMPRDPRDGDLIEREATALRRLATHGERRHRAYVPRIVETFRHRDAVTGAQRRVDVLRELGGFHDLARVRRAYPGDLDPRDAAWMWRRLLVALGFAHRAGVLHGAVLPEHVMIHPDEHGLVLVGWCNAVTGPGGRVPTMVDRHAGLYPPEVPGREPATPGTDLFMATRCMTGLMGDRTPPAMRAFARGCTLPAPHRRPSDAWRLLAEFDDLLERLYGPRRFRPFHLPPTDPAPRD
ncbi:protein kinase family protein [Actinomadura algeriensis]|uniref:Serine/threonine protein kinase n=1 Tax=Actinomadura algeriensis TaxID=1679523 RepID=A0ABR9JXG6_9ACTN|nr:molecular chaperone DnaJ [Actinomadura algeriensis]MBE1535068.1 serine/threonine protein kinase [Actinomadura algeriensis]